MKRVLLIAVLVVGLSAGYGYTDMDKGHMGMMGEGYGSSERSEYSQGMGSGMMGYGGYGMMGPGMIGQGMMGGYGMHPCMMGGGMMGGGMMGGHMGGYGMMGPGMMGGHMRGMMGQGMMGGYGYGSRGYDREAYEKYQKEYQKYLDDTTGLRKKMHMKKFEYAEAARNRNTKRETLMKIEKEMRDLQWEIYEKSPR